MAFRFSLWRARILSLFALSHYFPPTPSSHHISHPIIIMVTNHTNDAFPMIWPGGARIRRSGANMEPFVIANMQLVEQIRPHVEVGRRNSTSIQKWTECTNSFFHPSTGIGRNFTVPRTNAWKRFKKSMLSVIVFAPKTPLLQALAYEG